MSSTFNRRELLARGSAALLHLAVARPLRAHPAIPQFRSPLPLPPVLQPVRRDSAADYYEIAQREASVEIIPGMRTRIWGYDGIFPGPTIEARRGRAAVVTHTNRLGVPDRDASAWRGDAPAVGWLPHRYRRSWRNTHLRVRQRRTAGNALVSRSQLAWEPEEISTWVSPAFTC